MRLAEYILFNQAVIFRNVILPVNAWVEETLREKNGLLLLRSLIEKPRGFDQDRIISCDSFDLLCQISHEPRSLFLNLHAVELSKREVVHIRLLIKICILKQLHDRNLMDALWCSQRKQIFLNYHNEIKRGECLVFMEEEGPRGIMGRLLQPIMNHCGFFPVLSVTLNLILIPILGMAFFIKQTIQSETMDTITSDLLRTVLSNTVLGLGVGGIGFVVHRHEQHHLQTILQQIRRSYAIENGLSFSTLDAAIDNQLSEIHISPSLQR